MEVRILSSAPCGPRPRRMEITAQCRNMVEQQIRTWEVLEDRVLDLYYEIPRDSFVPEGLRQMSWSDMQLPFGEGQVMLEPKVEARILQELSPELVEAVCHIGTGTGFFAALLSKLCGKLTTVEINPSLAEAAKKRLEEHQVKNATVVACDGLAKDAIPGGPFDAIVLTGSVPTMPESLLGSLTSSGRLLVPVGTMPVLTVRLVRRTPASTISEDLFETWIPPLQNAPAVGGFSL